MARATLALSRLETGNRPIRRVVMASLAGREAVFHLARQPQRDAFQLAWSRDGSRVALVESVGTHADSGRFLPPTDVWTARADGTDARRLTRSGDASQVVWLSGGQILVTRSKVTIPASGLPVVSGALWVIPAAGGSGGRLTSPPVGSRDLAGSVAPEGNLVAFTRCGVATVSRTGLLNDPCAVFTVRVDGTLLTKLADRASDPSWSPDGSSIFFASDRDRTAKRQAGEDEVEWARELYRMNADGSDQTRLTRTTTESETQPRVSPSGTLVAFTSTKQFGYSSSVMVANADGSCPRRIEPQSSATWYGVLAWRPGVAADDRRLTC